MTGLAVADEPAPSVDRRRVRTGGGIIFEFKELEQAKAFAAAIKKRFGLDGRVFDLAERQAALARWADHIERLVSSGRDTP